MDKIEIGDIPKIASIGAARADKTGKAKDWSVQDALERALELVKSGEINADNCVIAISEKPDNNEEVGFHYFNKVPNDLIRLGLLTQAITDDCYA